ncbi:MAG: DUF4954 family protein [Muribaculum sp.]|nr:DUF4954 family protein [Muribaculum sp.]
MPTTMPQPSPSPQTAIPTSDSRHPQSRPLEWWEVQQLERQRCSATDWSLVKVGSDVDLSLIRDVEFIGANVVEGLDSAQWPGCGLKSITADNCRFEPGVRVRYVPGGLHNVLVETSAVIENTDRIEFEPEALCGQGVIVNVLDESGSRPVKIHAGLSAQSAALMARIPRRSEELFFPQIDEIIEANPMPLSIGAGARVIDCGRIINVSVGREVTVTGVRQLINGAIINNAAPGRPLAFIGSGVDAENFIVEDGRLDSGVIVRNCYIGQGASLEKGFTAHDSLFFANSSLENGEACALFAGPYTVSMHKASLLIGCQTSFLNAGSATNQSNHMYKLGPVHWGELERGVKTSSNSYLMLGARIGAFSLLMGAHKTHPDSSEFPFSYLFGDAQGATVVVPAMMLKSCGLLRDEKKWPNRDRRLKRRLPLYDRIIFEVLNPATVQRILTALDTIRELLTRPADDDRFIRYKGMKISRASLERAKKLYTLAIFKYLHHKLQQKTLPSLTVEEAERRHEIWVDLAGQLMPRPMLERAIDAESVEAREAVFNQAYEAYERLELEWIVSNIPAELLADPDKIKAGSEEFDAIVEEDRLSYREQLDAEQRMLSL